MARIDAPAALAARMSCSNCTRYRVARWAERHEPGSHGSHTYALTDFGIDADAVRAQFASYIEAYDATG